MVGNAFRLVNRPTGVATLNVASGPSLAHTGVPVLTLPRRIPNPRAYKGTRSRGGSVTSKPNTRPRVAGQLWQDSTDPRTKNCVPGVPNQFARQ